MEECRASKLTEGQRACLRLVAQAMTSKEIAARLGVSPHTVDQRLRMAMKTLGASSRASAARVLAESERDQPYQRLIYQSPTVAAATSPLPNEGTAAEWRREPADAEQVREARAVFDLADPAIDLTLPIPIGARRRNDLGPWQRMMWIVLIAILSAISFGALLNGMAGLARLFGWLG